MGRERDTRVFPSRARSFLRPLLPSYRYAGYPASKLRSVYLGWVTEGPCSIHFHCGPSLLAWPADTDKRISSRSLLSTLFGSREATTGNTSVSAGYSPPGGLNVRSVTRKMVQLVVGYSSKSEKNWIPCQNFFIFQENSCWKEPFRRFFPTNENARDLICFNLAYFRY